MKGNILKLFGVRFWLIIFICWSLVIYSQSADSKSITEKISDNKALFETDPSRALEQTDELLKEAIRLKNNNAELLVLSLRYDYNYFLKIDFEKMLASAQELKKKATDYKNPLYEAKAYKYIAQTYFLNELYEKAFEELKEGMNILERSDEENELIIMEKANIHTAFANIHSLKKEYFSGIQSLLNAVKEHKKIKDPEKKRGTNFMDYANLGGAYLYVNLDSAEYYAQKSLSKKVKNEEKHNLTFLNYIVLGNVYKEKKDYQNSLLYYKKAEDISENKHFVNVEWLYKDMISVYDSLGDSELKNQYEHKLKDLRIQVTQNQNKSLQKIVKESDRKNSKDDNSDNSNTILIILTIALVLVIPTIFYAKKQKKRSKDTIVLEPDNYNELIQLLKNNDPAFLLGFEKYYSGFSDKIRKINPDITNIELELLAMIRLKLSTKEIAKYKFLQPKTVNNRRHIIRKKLHLPSDTDLYNWVETL